jgi:hypothetical protein
MPLISFSVFKEKIKDGTKKQTIRKLRKYPIKKYDLLYMWWKSRTPQREKLGLTTCTEEFLIKMSIIDNGFNVYMSVWKVGETQELSCEERAELAELDGFDSITGMVEWFYKTHGEMNQECFQVIRWDELT